MESMEEPSLGHVWKSMQEEHMAHLWMFQFKVLSATAGVFGASQTSRAPEETAATFPLSPHPTPAESRDMHTDDQGRADAAAHQTAP